MMIRMPLHQVVRFAVKSCFLALFIGAAACSSNDRSQNTESNTKNITGSQRECYGYFANRDTVMLSFERVGGDSIRGNLLVQYYGKDRSRGTINGTLQNDLLLARYVFQSEGMTSIRQVAFKKSGNALVEGFGDVTEKNNEMIFKDTKSLQYNDAFKLSPIDCK